MSRLPWWAAGGAAVTAGVAVAVLGSSASPAGAAPAAVPSTQPGGPIITTCQTVTVEHHGREVARVRLCGLNLTRPATCRVVKGSFGQPAERWSCLPG